MTAIFFILLITGLIFIGAEIFVPGGILGVIGGISLAGAIIIAFNDPDISKPQAVGISCGIFILVLLAIAIWIKVFPKTWVGKHMMINEDLGDAKATESGLENLLNKTGITTSTLHPGGFAEISDHRYDVITQGEMIDCGKQISVVEIEGNRIVVEENN